jgi:hypothetical protein
VVTAARRVQTDDNFVAFVTASARMSATFPFCGIDYTPSIGVAALRLALNVLEGVAVPKRLDVNFQIVLSDGVETNSIKADVPLKDYVALDKPDDFIMGHGMGPSYDPKTFKAKYPT